MTEPSTSPVAPARIPLATYRLQLRPGFTLADAAAQIPYLAALGVSDLYLSPVFTAQAGSEHGYNVVDYGQVSPALGGESALESLGAALRERRMGLLLDMVSNHMGIGDETNRPWWDVLENGPSSPFASFFDIDWNPPKTDLANQVLLPVLGDQYGVVLEAGQLKIEYRGGSFVVRYYDRVFPIAPITVTSILAPLLERAREHLPAEHEALVELESIITHLKNLPLRTETNPDRIRERQREKEVARRRLEALLESNAALRTALELTLADLNGRTEDPHSFDTLDGLLNAQAYRLCHWRVAADEINYRRFFDVNELAAIRVESPEVFALVHQLVNRHTASGIITGLRIDHIDGLHDPEQYLADLQAGYRAATGKDEELYVVVEKILDADERLNPSWRTQGTVGYDFLNALNGVFVDRSRERALLQAYRRLVGELPPFAEVAHQSKKLILLVAMTSELHVLARKLDRISEQHRRSRDFTASNLKFALREVIAAFPAYRSYIRPSGVSPADRDLVETAIRAAKRRNPATSASVFDFIASVLLMDDPPGLSAPEIALRREFAMRFQQLTAPVTAKGIEDTAFYRWYPLASLNEVGGDPRRFGVPVEEFHFRNQERLERWPHALLATSTHDTKRGEDTRARLNALSEIPGDWEAAVGRWRTLNRPLRIEVEGEESPNANEEYLLYQTLIGAWPFQSLDEAARREFEERIARYMEKALREAKERTSWIKPNEPHDKAVRDYVHALLSPDRANAFLPDFLAFARPVMRAGAWNSLCQVVLKLAAPGVPDFYQGSEFWDLSLVDPDNRRAVDFPARAAALAELRGNRDPHLVRELVETIETGRLKLFVTHRALDFRRRARDLFERGAYVPLAAVGRSAEHVVAFGRVHERQAALAVTGRFFLKLTGGDARTDDILSAWGHTELRLPAPFSGLYRDVFTGRKVVVQGASTGEPAPPTGPFRRLVDRLRRAAVKPVPASVPLDPLFRELPFALLERIGGPA